MGAFSFVLLLESYTTIMNIAHMAKIKYKALDRHPSSINLKLIVNTVNIEINLQTFTPQMELTYIASVAIVTSATDAGSIGVAAAGSKGAAVALEGAVYAVKQRITG